MSDTLDEPTLQLLLKVIGGFIHEGQGISVRNGEIIYIVSNLYNYEKGVSQIDIRPSYQIHWGDENFPTHEGKWYEIQPASLLGFEIGKNPYLSPTANKAMEVFEKEGAIDDFGRVNLDKADKIAEKYKDPQAVADLINENATPDATPDPTPTITAYPENTFHVTPPIVTPEPTPVPVLDENGNRKVLDDATIQNEINTGEKMPVVFQKKPWWKFW
jgi:hypothetical protein